MATVRTNCGHLGDARVALPIFVRTADPLMIAQPTKSRDATSVPRSDDDSENATSSGSSEML